MASAVVDRRLAVRIEMNVEFSHAYLVRASHKLTHRSSNISRPSNCILGFSTSGGRFEEARRRKLDYAEYFALALRYGPLGEGDFERAIFPGRSYHGNLFDASRLIQTWWWGLWPSILRRRKAAALMIQARFRGHVQRIRWQAIIRLRTMWGYTRIVAHAYTCWRDSVAKIRRAKAFARRLKNRCLARCLAALASLTRERRETRQDIVRERIRRMSLTLRDRVFDAWVLFTEKSLAVKRMRWHSLVYPTFDSWRRKVFRDRSFSRLRWACAVLVGRLMRWKATTRYVRLCKACIKIQRLVRVKLAITRTRNAVRHSRTCRAEEAIQREKVCACSMNCLACFDSFCMGVIHEFFLLRNRRTFLDRRQQLIARGERTGTYERSKCQLSLQLFINWWPKFFHIFPA